MQATQPATRESSPVDDVRRVREKLDREVQGDIRALAERAREAAQKYREKLGLKLRSLLPDERHKT